MHLNYCLRYRSFHGSYPPLWFCLFFCSQLDFCKCSFVFACHLEFCPCGFVWRGCFPTTSLPFTTEVQTIELLFLYASHFITVDFISRTVALNVRYSLCLAFVSTRIYYHSELLYNPFLPILLHSVMVLQYLPIFVLWTVISVRLGELQIQMPFSCNIKQISANEVCVKLCRTAPFF